MWDFVVSIISGFVTYLLIACLSPNLLPENWRDRFAKDESDADGTDGDG